MKSVLQCTAHIEPSRLNPRIIVVAICCNHIWRRTPCGACCSRRRHASCAQPRPGPTGSRACAPPARRRGRTGALPQGSACCSYSRNTPCLNEFCSPETLEVASSLSGKYWSIWHGLQRLLSRITSPAFDCLVLPRGLRESLGLQHHVNRVAHALGGQILCVG